MLDALGVRWGLDLGADNYNLPGYFGNRRWTYYRLRAEGHNTLVINPSQNPDQDPAATAKITTSRDQGLAIADLTAAYSQHARFVRRGISMFGRTEVRVQDEIETKAPADIWWFFHTAAEIQIAENGHFNQR